MKILMRVLQSMRLPVGTRPKTRNRASISEKTPAIKISERELENLRHKTNLLPDEIASLVSSFLVTPVRDIGEDSAYPAPNFDLARKLYDILNTIESETVASSFVVCPTALLCRRQCRSRRK